jgi:hypothetical protein
MGRSEHDPAAKERRPWNVGPMGCRQTCVEATAGLGRNPIVADRFIMDDERASGRWPQ